MPDRPQDLYGNFGSVPENVAANGSGAGNIGVRATPADAGAQVGQAMSNAGGDVSKLGDDAVSLAIKRQGMINETLATNAESAFIQRNSAAKGQFMATEGMETNNALPAYREAIQNDSDIRKTLPAGALKMYDMLATRQKANYLSDAESYAAGQVKTANMTTAANSVNVQQLLAGDPDNAARIHEIQGNIKYATAQQLDADAPFIKKDPKTGEVQGFDESTPAGQQAKATYQAALDHNTGIAYENAVKAQKDPLKASAFYDSIKDRVPADARVRIEASLAPRVIDAYAQGGVSKVMLEANQAHQQLLTNPSSTPVSGDMNKPIPGLGGLTGAQVPPVTPEQLHMSAVPSPDSQGIPPPGVPARNYSKNPDDSPVSRADYYTANRDVIMAAADKYAEETYPGNPRFQAMVRQRVTNQIDAAKEAQTAQYSQDRNYIQRGITGELTNGKPPSTYDELYRLPGMADVINRTQVHSSDYAKGIDTQIAKMGSHNPNINSPNGYDTITRALEPYDRDHPNGIFSQDHLDRLMGRSDGTGINLKDYNDAKKAIDTSPEWKSAILENMNRIANANGNQDGKGQQRAIGFYTFAMKEHDAIGKEGNTMKETDLTSKTSKKYIGYLADQYMAPRSTQVANVAQNMRAAVPMSSVAPRQPNESPDDYLKRTGL